MYQSTSIELCYIIVIGFRRGFGNWITYFLPFHNAEFYEFIKIKVTLDKHTSETNMI